MSRLLVRLGFVGYLLALAVLALGRFSTAVDSALAAVGLRSAVGILGYLFAGLIVTYVVLWRMSADLRKGPAGRPEISPFTQPDQAALVASASENPSDPDAVSEDSERR